MIIGSVKMAKKEKDNGARNLILGIVIGVIIIGAIFMIYNSSINNSTSSFGSQDSSSQSENSKNSCRDIEVPYQDTETYIDQEAYQDLEYYDYYLKLEKILAYTQERLEVLGRGLYDEARVDIKNIDNIGEWVTVTFYWKTISKEWEDTDRQFIEPGETIRFISVYDKDAGEDTTFSYTYKSDAIEKSKYVTKYRDVQKTRAVTKYKTETQCD